MDETPIDDTRTGFDEAFEQGRFNDALAAATGDLMDQLERLLMRDGYQITFRKRPKNSIEFFGGIAATLDEQIAREGDDARHSLLIGRELSASLLELQGLLRRGTPEGAAEEDALGQLLLQAMAVGARAEHLGLSIAGHFDEFARLKVEEFIRKGKQRDAAARTNAKRSVPKERALKEATRICAVNPSLSNADLGEKVRDAAGISTTIKTTTEWVRGWRHSGLLPPLKSPRR